MTEDELRRAIRALFHHGRAPDENEVLRVAAEYGNTCRAEALAGVRDAVLAERARIKIAYERRFVRPFFDAIDDREKP